MAYVGCINCGKTMKDDGTPCPACGLTAAEVASQGPQWFCTSCGSDTNPVRLGGVNAWIFLGLCLLFVLPAIIYLVFAMVTAKQGCPYCRQATLIPIGSPVAVAARAARNPSAVDAEP